MTRKKKYQEKKRHTESLVKHVVPRAWWQKTEMHILFSIKILAEVFYNVKKWSRQKVRQRISVM